MAWVHSLGIKRPWRRQGIALAMLLHTFGQFYRRGIAKVGLGVDGQSLTGATRLYEKAGMHPAHQETLYEKELRPGVELATQSLAEQDTHG
jgi:mycothiol synthase